MRTYREGVRHRIDAWKLHIWSSFIGWVYHVSAVMMNCLCPHSSVILVFISWVIKCHPPVCIHDDVIKWKHFPRYWPFVWGIHRSPVNSPHKDQWRRALMFSLIYIWINGWANNRETGDLGRYRAHYDVTILKSSPLKPIHYSLHFCFLKPIQHSQGYIINPYILQSSSVDCCYYDAIVIFNDRVANVTCSTWIMI